MGDESINFQPPFKPNDDSDGTEDEEEAVEIQLEPPRRKSRKSKKEDDPVTQQPQEDEPPDAPKVRRLRKKSEDKQGAPQRQSALSNQKQERQGLIGKRADTVKALLESHANGQEENKEAHHHCQDAQADLAVESEESEGSCRDDKVVGKEGNSALTNVKRGLFNNFKEVLVKSEINRKFKSLFNDVNRAKAQEQDDSAASNKKHFIQKYGISCQIPSLYIQQAIICKKNPIYSIQVLNYVLPDKDEYDVESHYLDGSVEKTCFHDLYKEKVLGFTLRFLKSDKNLQKVEIESEIIVAEKTADGHPVQHADLYFSNDCKYFVIFLRQISELRVFTVKDDNLWQLQKDIKGNRTLFVIKKFKVNNQLHGLSFMEKIIFDLNNRYIIAKGNDKIAVFNIAKLKKLQSRFKELEGAIYDIDLIRYEAIYDVYFESSSNTNFMCLAACKMQNVKQIHLVDIQSVQLKNENEFINYQINTKINFFQEQAFNFQAKIYQQGGTYTVVLVNGKENFIMQGIGGSEEDCVKKNLNQIGNGIIHHISDCKADCEHQSIYIIASEEYDQNLHIYDSEDFSYDIKINRIVQPNTTRILDFHFQDHMSMLSLIDGEFIINSMDENLLQNFYSFSSISAFSIKWPYIIFSGLGNFLILVTVFDRQTLHRIEIAPETQTMKVCQTFVTNTNDMYIVIRQEQHFKLLTLNLDDINEFENQHKSIEEKNESYQFKHLFQYKCDEVDYLPLLDLFVRGSSRKEVIQLNHRLQVFFLHFGRLFAWVEPFSNEESLLEEIKTTNFKIISKSLKIMNSEDFFFCQYSDQDEEQESLISHVSVKFNTFEVNTVVSENSSRYNFQSFSIDEKNNMLFLVLEYLQKSVNSPQQYFLKIYDLREDDKQIFQTPIVNEKLQGVLESDMYTLIDGHMYFNNNVFKIRYDLMQNKTMRNLTNDEIFNQYDDILDLEENEQIKMDTPMNSFQSHKFLYIVINHKKLAPKKLIVLPYLHERKIYFNRIKANTDYFYTSIMKDRAPSHRHGEAPSVVNLAIVMQNNMSSELTEIDTRMSDQEFAARNKKIPIFICMNLAEHKYYCYSENAQLINRVDYSNWVKQFGEPISTSSDGLNFIFKKKRKTILNIIHMDERELTLIKQFDILKELEECIRASDPEEKGLLKKQGWLNYTKVLEYDFQINNNFDIVVCINKVKNTNGSSDIKRKQSRSMQEDMGSTIYFYLNGKKIIKNWWKDQQSKEIDTRLQNLLKRVIDEHSEVQRKDRVFFKENYKIDTVDFQASHNFLFFWNRKKIEYYSLSKPLTEENKMMVALKVAISEKNSSIRKIDFAPNSDVLAIVIDNLQTSTVFQWDLNKNIEIRAFEVDKKHQIIWGHNDKMILLTRDITILSQEQCALKCFVNDNFDQRGQTVFKKRLDYNQGYRFDSLTYNWLVLKEFVQMPFSYMTFVIKNHLETMKNDQTASSPLFNRAFDVEAYNYLINKNTCFITGDLVKQKYLELQYVLQNFEKKDPTYLEILNYKKEGKPKKSKKQFGFMNNDDEPTCERLSALHSALLEGNNRAIDILLNYMAKIPLNCSENFKDILHFLVDQQSFLEYLDSLTDQTQQLADKNVLRVLEPYTEEFVSIAGSNSTYIDDLFFEEQMGESNYNLMFKSYPVDMQLLKVGWILNTDDGKNLLQAIYDSERLDFFEIQALNMIVEYLYQKNKLVMMKIQLPLYLIQGALFALCIMQTEKVQAMKRQNVDPQVLEDFKNSQKLLSWANQVVSMMLILIMCIIFNHMGTKFFKRFYTWIDICFYSLNTMISIIVLTFEENEANKKMERILACFAVFLFLNKSFYYMKLVDSIAPFIDIIIQIVVDIQAFMIVFFTAMIALSCSFFLLAQNQIDFDMKDDEKTREEKEKVIPYSTISSSLWYMWQLCLGGANTKTYSIGEASQTTYLTGFYILAQFFMIIHLLNLLIAIMGETFANCKEVGHLVKVRDHLSFIIDNWYLNSISIPNRDSIVFIVTAFLVNTGNQNDNELVSELKDQISAHRQEVQDVQSLIIKRQLEIESTLHQINRNMEKIIENNDKSLAIEGPK